MAKNNKKQEEKKVNRLAEFFFSEHKIWDILGLFSGVFAILIGFMLLVGDLRIYDGFFIIGEYPTIFAWMVFGLGVIMLVMIGWPFYEPSIEELKKVTYPSKSKLFNHTARTFGFMAFLLLVLFLMNLLIDLTPLGF